jgi:hypothetical protein
MLNVLNAMQNTTLTLATRKPYARL